jgi:hypothetical protein
MDLTKNQEGAQPSEELIPINGFQQVLEMLRAADAPFRESLLRRIAQKDPALANSLRRDLRTI